jgi:hypothetical protein
MAQRAGKRGTTAPETPAAPILTKLLFDLDLEGW